MRIARRFALRAEVLTAFAVLGPAVLPDPWLPDVLGAIEVQLSGLRDADTGQCVVPSFTRPSTELKGSRAASLARPADTLRQRPLPSRRRLTGSRPYRGLDFDDEAGEPQCWRLSRSCQTLAASSVAVVRTMAGLGLTAWPGYPWPESADPGISPRMHPVTVVRRPASVPIWTSHPGAGPLASSTTPAATNASISASA